MSSQTPAGWYPDPERPGQQRYWDGQQWTENRAAYAQAAVGSTVTAEQARTLRARGRKRALLVIAAVVGVLAVVGVVSSLTSSTDDPASSTAANGVPSDSDGDEEVLPPSTFKAKVTATRVLSPASLVVFALVKNTSDVEGRATCFVHASDPSGAYEGYDSFDVRGGFIDPGERRLLRADLIVTNEGAIWATDVSVECEDRDA